MTFKFYQAKSFLNNISVFLVNQLRNISIVNVNFTGEKYDLIVRNNYSKNRTINRLMITINNSTKNERLPVRKNF
jgi:hypothetical protein